MQLKRIISAEFDIKFYFFSCPLTLETIAIIYLKNSVICYKLEGHRFDS
jgi:hypothetical protein